jgi:type IX secretion system PorP/SprF family membrane protein
MKKEFLLLASLSISAYVLAQDIHFTQVSEIPLLVNPALTGVFNGTTRAGMSYRNQWAGYDKAFTTLAASADFHLLQGKGKAGEMGAGGYLYRDASATNALQTTQVVLSVSSIRKLNNNNKLSAGIQFGFYQRRLNVNQLSWDNQYDGAGFNTALPSGETNLNTRFIRPDFTAGINWHYGSSERTITSNDEKLIDAGISLYHIARPDQSFLTVQKDPLAFRITFFSRASLSVKNTNLAIQPALFLAQQDAHTEILVQTLLRYQLKATSVFTGRIKSAYVSMGLGYRVKDALQTLFLMNLGDYALGFSYDMRLPGLGSTAVTSGGPEITLRFQR